jgi:Ca2+-binding RTX toxin-like protein
LAIQKGTAANNSIYGTANADTQYGYGGNDYIEGRGGNDKIYGGDGLDRLLGGDGSDYLYGENGNDSISGGNQKDWLYGGAGNDTLDAGTGNDTVNGGAGNDRVLGGDGIDMIQGGDGNDSISGGNGNDTIHGGNGNDTVYSDLGLDKLFGDAGDDILQGNGKDDDFLYGGTGRDTLYVKENDFADGGADNDTFIADRGFTDWNNAGNTIVGGSGVDTIVYNNNLAASHSIAGSGWIGNELTYDTGEVDGRTSADYSGIERFVFTGTAPAYYRGDGSPAVNMEVVGSNQGDYLLGSAGNDVFKGGAGDDHLYGGHGGNNTLTGGAGADWFALVDERDGVTHVTDFHKGEDRLFLDANMGHYEENGSTVFIVDDWRTDYGVSKLIVDGVTDLHYGYDWDINDIYSGYSQFFGSVPGAYGYQFVHDTGL